MAETEKLSIGESSSLMETGQKPILRAIRVELNIWVAFIFVHYYVCICVTLMKENFKQNKKILEIIELSFKTQSVTSYTCGSKH